MASPAENIGLKEGDLVKFNGPNGVYGTWENGDTIRFVVDDHTTCPMFESLDKSEQWYVDLERIQPIKKGNNPVSNAVNFQQLAIRVFGNIVERAEAYRLTGHQDDSKFRPSYGICDNVYLAMEPGREQDRYHDEMLMVKDNLIRRVPSYSGSYHFPVLAPGSSVNDPAARRLAEEAYEKNRDKWKGDYGAERLIQAKEILDMVTNQWDDAFVKRMTPAARVGITSDVVVQHLETGLYYQLSRDDDSSDPYFVPFGDTDNSNRKCISLGELRVINVESFEKRSMTSLVNDINRRITKRKKIEEKVRELQNMIKEMRMQQAGLELSLRTQHNVIIAKS